MRKVLVDIMPNTSVKYLNIGVVRDAESKEKHFELTFFLVSVTTITLSPKIGFLSVL